jgi:DNA-binding NarL/FixJ family response regulator
METRCPALLIVSDVRLYRDHLAALLAAQPLGLTIETARTGADAIDRVTAQGPHIVLLDLRCRDSQHVVQTIAAIRPTSRIIAFGVDDNERDILACAEAGASAYVPADASVEDLVRAIEIVMRGDQHLPPQVAAALLRRLAAHDAGDAAATGSMNLTARERQILALVVQGCTNKEIASRLHIEVATVKNHVHNLLLKLRVRSRSEAAARVREGSRSWMQIPEPHLN